MMPITPSTYPNLFLIGAPKCGTTSLVYLMSQHPEIFIPYRKEPLFFCHDFRYRRIDTIEDYRAMYAGVGPGQAWAVDASTSYVYVDGVRDRILEYSPDARFVLLVRDPLKMVPSYYHEQRLAGMETLPTLEEAWTASPSRRAGRNVPRNCVHPRLLCYDQIASYAALLRAFLGGWSPERLHVIVFDDLQADPEGVFAGLCSFLGISRATDMDFSARNVRREWRSPLLQRALTAPQVLALKRRLVKKPTRLVERFGFRKVAPVPISSAMAETICSAYADDVRDLEAVLGRPLPGWLRPHEKAAEPAMAVGQ